MLDGFLLAFLDFLYYLLERKASYRLEEQCIRDFRQNSISLHHNLILEDLRLVGFSQKLLSIALPFACNHCPILELFKTAFDDYYDLLET